MKENKDKCKVLSVWIDLIGTKDKIKKLNKQDFLDYLHKFNKIVIESMYSPRYFGRLFHVEGFAGTADPPSFSILNRDMYRYANKIKLLIFADTIYLEILEIKWLDFRVLFWLKDLYEKCGDECPLSIYISMGELFPYSEEIQELPKKLKKDLDIRYPPYPSIPPDSPFYGITFPPTITQPSLPPVSEKIEIFTMFGLSKSLERIREAENFGKRYNLGEGIFIQKDIWDEFVKGEKNLKNKPIDILFYQDSKRVEFIKIDFPEILESNSSDQ